MPVRTGVTESERAAAALAAAQASIEAQLAAVGVAWTGFELLSRDEGAPDEGSRSTIVAHRSTPQLASTLAALPVWARATLVTEDGHAYFALREPRGVRTAPEGTPAARALLETHRVRGDLGFAGAYVEATGDALRVAQPPDLAPVASPALGLVPGDVIRGAVPAEGALAVAQEPTSLQLVRGDEAPRPLRAEPGDPVVQESLAAVRRRLTGRPVPVEHWLTRAGVPAGAILVSASVGSSPAWDAGSDLGSLDEVLERARAAGERLDIQLVTSEGLERRLLAPSPAGVTAVEDGRRVAVALSAHAPRGSELRALLDAGAPYAFEVASTGGRASRASSAPVPDPSGSAASPGSASEAFYRAVSAQLLVGIERQEALMRGQGMGEAFDALKAAMPPMARASLERLRADAAALAQVPVAADEATIAEHLARSDADALLEAARARRALEHDGRDEAGVEPAAEPIPDAARAPSDAERLELADALVDEAAGVAADRALSVEERHRRIDRLVEDTRTRWYELPQYSVAAIAAPGAELEALPEEDHGTGYGEDTIQPLRNETLAGETSDAGAGAPTDEELALLRSRVATLEGIRNALRSARAAGDPPLADRLEDGFMEAARARPKETLRARAEGLAKLGSELLAAADHLAPALDGPSGLQAAALMGWLTDEVLSSVRLHGQTTSSARDLVAAHRRLVDEQLPGVGGTSASAPEPVPAHPRLADEQPPSLGGTGASAPERAARGADDWSFSSRADLETYLRTLERGQTVRLFGPDGRSFIQVQRRSSGGWGVERGWLDEKP